MNTKDLVNYKPYTLGKMKNDGYMDIYFENEGIMTVPKNSATAIVDLLNGAFKNGVKMTLKSVSSSIPMPSDNSTLDANFKAKPMPLEEPHPINSVVRKK